VAIDGTQYAPATVTVRRGQPVSWTNKDPFPHTVTVPGLFDSGNMAPGATWTYVPRRAGQYDYICTLHPNMRGRLVVE
jgi:plastocyanin